MGSFETSGPPTAKTFAAHWLDGESLRLLGAVNPDSQLTSAEQVVGIEGAPTGGTFTLTFKGATTAPIAYPASAGSIETALQNLLSGPSVGVEGVQGGPYTVWFVGADAGMAEPTIEAHNENLSGGTVKVATTQAGGEGYDTHYHFQYVSQRAFSEHGWAEALETSPVDLGSGDTSQTVGAVLPALRGGETYRYRVVAVSTAPGTAPVVGSEETLIAPAKPSVSTGACPNEVFRIGLSANLPDCRAYEQVTPVDKEGAQEPFHYRAGIASAVLVGEDGGHAVLEAPEVSYGSGAGAGQSPYLFSRGEGDGWLMKAGAPQPETGVASVAPQLYSADLTQIAFASAYAPSRLSESPDEEYKIGPVGGPYAAIASVPRGDIVEGGGSSDRERTFGWVAANGDFSKLVLQTEDRTLLGAPTGTRSGPDLYEYTPRGGLRQLNVTEVGGETSTIGSCGARMVYGQEAPESNHVVSSSHSVSADGSRVFFEAVPGRECSQARHLFMRVDGAETVDIGAYTFVAANAEGTRVVLSNEEGEFVGYDTETKAFEPRSGEEVAEEQELSLLGIPVRIELDGGDTFARPRYTYWSTARGERGDGQVYRYDGEEHLIECISCASPFDPEPRRAAFLQDVQGLPRVNGGQPSYTAVSANGEFAFFTTVAALLPQDVDGEIPAEYNTLKDEGEFINVGGHISPSTDVYEWRAGGVDGCGLVQGCLALITDGRGGFLNLLLGTADEGKDVFIYTRSTLLAEGHGAEGSLGEGNIYDVRVGGGFTPPAQRPTECEGDACSTPPGAPNDATPSSLTFMGVGNVLAAPSVKPATTKSKKPKRARRKKTGKRGNGRKAGRSRHSNHQRGR